MTVHAASKSSSSDPAHGEGRGVRVFIAVPIPAALRRILAETASAAFGDMPNIRAVPARSMHLTLKFLGDIETEAAHNLGQALSLLARQHQAFSLEAQGVGGFPDLKSPRVLWVGLTGEAQRLIDLARAVDRMVSELGFPEEKRPFTPHLTLARLKSAKQMGLLRKRVDALKDRSFGVMPVEEIVLYRSDLRPEGARYTPLAGARLR